MATNKYGKAPALPTFGTFADEVLLMQTRSENALVTVWRVAISFARERLVAQGNEVDGKAPRVKDASGKAEAWQASYARALAPMFPDAKDPARTAAGFLSKVWGLATGPLGEMLTSDDPAATAALLAAGGKRPERVWADLLGKDDERNSKPRGWRELLQAAARKAHEAGVSVEEFLAEAGMSFDEAREGGDE